MTETHSFLSRDGLTCVKCQKPYEMHAPPNGVVTLQEEPPATASHREVIAGAISRIEKILNEAPALDCVPCEVRSVVLSNLYQAQQLERCASSLERIADALERPSAFQRFLRWVNEAR